MISRKYTVDPIEYKPQNAFETLKVHMFVFRRGQYLYHWPRAGTTAISMDELMTRLTATVGRL